MAVMGQDPLSREQQDTEVVETAVTEHLRPLCGNLGSAVLGGPKAVLRLGVLKTSQGNSVPKCSPVSGLFRAQD